MKKKYIFGLYSLFGLIVSLALMLVSCSLEDDHGYPKVVEMPTEGGIVKLYGEEPPYSISIVNNREEYVPSSYGGDTLVITYEWLTVKQEKYGYIITVNAEPNLTENKRKLKILAHFPGNTYTYIDVVQKK